MLTWIVTIFLSSIIVSLCIFNYYIRCGRVAKYLDKLPGPYAYPLLGTLPYIFKSNDKIWPAFEKLNNTYYPIWRGWAPQWGIAVLLHPDDIEVLLSSIKPIEKSIVYKVIEQWLNEGLLLSKADKWFNRRKMLTPAFHFNILKKYMEIMLEQSEKLTHSITEETIIDLTPFLNKYTLSVICETAMGTKLNDGDDEVSEKYRLAVYEIGKNAVYRVLRPWFLTHWIFDWFSIRGWQQPKLLKFLHTFSSKIISERQNYHNNTDGKYLENLLSEENDKLEEEEEAFGFSTKKKRLAMLDLLIKSQREGLIDDNGIREEVDTFTFEGHDTSAMALTYAVQLLAQHTEIQARAREEVNEIWKSCNGKFTNQELNKMVYLERCIKEVLRLYPSVPFISRRLRDDLQLKKYLLPRDSVAAVFIYDLHRDPNFWPDPIKFDPDRFLPERSQTRHPFSYIPFSAGPRNCVGQRFAMLELKIFCAYILHSFNLEAIEKHENFARTPDFVLRPIKKIHVKFIPIKS